MEDIHQRFRALWHLRTELPKEKLIEEFGDIWRQSESHFQDQPVINRLLEFIGLEKSALWNILMDKEDKGEFQKLRARGRYVRVYRGCWQSNRDGWSWTTDKAVAERFAKRDAPDGYPLILSGKVIIDDVIAYFNGRQEKEIVVRPGNIKEIKVAELPFQEPKAMASMFQLVQSGNLFTPEQEKEKMIMTGKFNPEAYLKFLGQQLEFFKKYNFKEKTQLFEEVIEEIKKAA